MPSLLRQLFDTMPLTGVRGAIRSGHGPDRIEEAPASSVADYVTYYDTSEAQGIEMTCAAPSTKDREGPARFVPIWSWKSTRLNGFERLGCRVRDDDFKQFLVVENVAWGLESGEGLEPAVEIELAGLVTKLPLTEPYHLLSFVVEGGYNVPNLDPMYPLEAHHDPSIVHAFVYDVVPTPRRMMALADPAHPQAEEVEALRAACRQAFPLTRENVALGSMKEEVFIDQLWPEPLQLDNPFVFLQEIVSLQARPARVLVAVCLTTCREDWRFTPGSMAGMGRINPQLFVKSNAPLGRVRAMMNVNRPSHMTVLDPPSGKCSCEEMQAPMASVLVSDANIGMESMYGSLPYLNDQQVYWSNLFAYVVTEPAATTKGTVLNVVRNDRISARYSLGMVRRYPVRWLASGAVELWEELFGGDDEPSEQPSTLVWRVARQGPFDNIHMAPRMRMGLGANPTWATPITNPDAWDAWEHYPIDPGIWRTEDVAMAPVCAHDCFHMHWRWSDVASDQWTNGWGLNGPYTVPGAAMIPLNQELDIKMRSEHQFTYRARAVSQPANEPVVFCRHGASYALTVGVQIGLTAPPAPLSGRTVVATARGSVQLNTVPLTAFADGEGKFLRATTSWAVFYWQLRYDIVMIEGKPVPRERAQIDDLPGLLKL